MVGLIAAENCYEVLVKSINQGIAYALWESCFACKGAHSIHHLLIVSKNRRSNQTPLGIKIQLLYVFEHGLRLVGITRAQLVEDGGAKLVPCKL
jgi:hypothetical protein